MSTAGLELPKQTIMYGRGVISFRPGMLRTPFAISRAASAIRCVRCRYPSCPILTREAHAHTPSAPGLDPGMVGVEYIPPDQCG